MAEAEACAGREESGGEENGDEDPGPASRRRRLSPLRHDESAHACEPRCRRRCCCGVWHGGTITDASDAVPHGKTLEEPRLLRRHAWPERRASRSIARFGILPPVGPFGSSSKNTIRRGYLAARPPAPSSTLGARRRRLSRRGADPTCAAPRPVARPRFRRQQFRGRRGGRRGLLDLAGVRCSRRARSGRSSCRRGTGSARRRGTRRRGREPAVAIDRLTGRLLVLPVAGDDRQAAELDLLADAVDCFVDADLGAAERLADRSGFRRSPTLPSSRSR